MNVYLLTKHKVTNGFMCTFEHKSFEIVRHSTERKSLIDAAEKLNKNPNTHHSYKVKTLKVNEK